MIKGGNPRTVFTALSIRSRMSSLITLSISKGVKGDIMTNGLHIYRLLLGDLRGIHIRAQLGNHKIEPNLHR